MAKVYRLGTVRSSLYSTLIAVAVSLGLSLSGALLPAVADDLYIIPETVTVENSMVTLEDIFGPDLTAHLENAAMPVMTAPKPGKSFRFRSNRLNSLAARYNIDWKAPLSGFSVTIKRTGVQVTPEDLTAIIEDHLMGQGLSGSVSVSLRFTSRNIYIPTLRSLDEIYVERLDKRGNSDQFIATIQMPNGDSDFQRMTVNGSLVEMMQVPVLANNILRGDVITEKDITYMDVNIRKVKDIAIDAREIIGMTGKRTLRAKNMISMRDITPPLLVRKGEEISVKLTRGILSIEMRAIAVEDGAKGDMISIKNINSGRTLKATVIGDKQARVTPGKTATASGR